MPKKNTLKDLHILIIEDNPGDARLIEEMFAEAKRIHAITTYAGSLKRGAQLLSEKSFDLLLLDLNLPDSFGLASFEKLSRAFTQLPIIIMTGLDDEETGIRAMSLGAQDYIVKGSYGSKSLERVIEYAIERNQIKLRLKKSEARFRKLIEKNADGILIVGNDGVIRFANKAYEKLSGRYQEEAIGKAFGFPMMPKDVSEINIVRPDRQIITAEIRKVEIDWEGEDAYLISCRDITDRKNLEIEREAIITRLENALAEVETLTGLLPICSYCKKVKSDEGYWTQIETYIQDHSRAKFSHGICKECAEEHFPDIDIDDE